MARTTANMALRAWNLASDKFNHAELDANWTKVDEHNHATGKGVQIPTGGIADLAVTAAKIADGSITTAKIPDGAITSAKIANGTIVAADLAAQEAWREIGTANQPVFENGWTNYGGSHNTAAFMKDALGFVHLKGLIANGTVGAAAFTLPAGYRPAAIELVATISNGALGRVDIFNTGVVQASAPSSNAWVSLNNLAFRAL